MTREEKQALAGDYVLGLLDEPAQRDSEAAMAADPELAGMVETLGARLLALDDTADPMPVDPRVWAGIESRLGAVPEASNVVPMTSRPAARSAMGSTGWMAIAASVVVAGGLGYMLGTSRTVELQPTVVAVLLDPADSSPGAIVEAFADDSVRIVPLVDYAVPEGSILQVWTLPDPATGPVSLGTLTAPLDKRLAGPDLPLPQTGQLYEITLEPAPGSPTGRPTGPILAKGFAASPPV